MAVAVGVAGGAGGKGKREDVGVGVGGGEGEEGCHSPEQVVHVLSGAAAPLHLVGPRQDPRSVSIRINLHSSLNTHRLQSHNTALQFYLGEQSIVYRNHATWHASVKIYHTIQFFTWKFYVFNTGRQLMKFKLIILYIIKSELSV